MANETHTPETEARLAELMRVMRALEWRRGETGAVYAERWGLSLDRVNHLAAEAWRRVAAEVKDASQAVATIGTILENVALSAYQDSLTPQLLATENGTRQESPNAYRKTAIDAGEVLVKLIGAMAPTRSEVTGKDGAPLVDENAHATILARLAGLAAREAPAEGAGSGSGEPEPG